MTGALSELAVESDLIRRGFNVARPTMTARYDLIAERDGRCWRVQTKTLRTEGRNNTLKASWDEPYTVDQVDVIALYAPDSDETFYVDASRVSDTSVTIRFTPSSRESSTGFVADEVRDWPFETKGA